MDAKTAKAVPITEYLARAGCQPVRVQGTDWWYLSPLRNEKTPSFKVNSEKNVWYDHGEGRGGTAIDLAMAMGDLSPGEAIRELCGMAWCTVRTELPAPRAPAVRMPEDSARSVIVAVRPLSEGANARYVESGRRIPAEISAKYLVEVRYRLADGREFSAAGFENRSGGYELRSASFKGSVGRKDFSVIGKPEAWKPVRVFEGFMDFLSAQALWPGEAGIPAVVMNSVAMAVQAADYVAVTGAVPMAFLDNDEAGERGFAALASVCSRPVSDERGRYAGSKDVNGYLVSLAQADTAGIRAQIRD